MLAACECRLLAAVRHVAFGIIASVDQMAGQLPPITPPPPVPPKPTACWCESGMPSSLSAVPKEPAPDEGTWYRAAFRPWSLPTRVAVFVAVVLIAIVLACWWEFRTNPIMSRGAIR